MKKIFNHINLSLWLLALFCIPAWADQIDYSLTFSADSLRIEQVTIDTETYSQVTYAGLSSSGTAGQPTLPQMRIAFSVPYDAKNIEVKTSLSHSAEITLSSPVLPGEKDYRMNDSIRPPLAKDISVYGCNSYFPEKNAAIVSEGMYMGENKVVTVAVCPVKYNPSLNTLAFSGQVSVSLKYDRARGTEPGNLLVRKNRKLRQQAWDELKERVVNPGDVERFAPAAAVAKRVWDKFGRLAENGGNRDQVVPDNFCEYLIVTSRALEHSFRRLAALKRQKGYTVQIRCYEDILTDPITQYGDTVGPYGINDDAGKIREFLRYCFVNYGTQYVLMGGNTVPFRYGTYHDGNSITEVPTDLYYSELTTNWNVDNDTEYGEIYKNTPGLSDTFSFEPQLYVGRLFCRDDDDVQNYTDKLLCYELNPGHGDMDYLKKAFYYEHRDQLNASIGMSTHLINCHPTFLKMVMQLNVTTGASIINAINGLQPGFIGMFAHGNTSVFRVNNNINNTGQAVLVQSLDARVYPGFYQENGNGLDNLDNRFSPGVFFASACHTAPFDGDTQTGDPRRNCADSYTTGKGYGGVGYFGYTRDSYQSASTNFADTLSFVLPKTGSRYGECRLGKVLAKTRELMPLQLYQNMIANLIGDPEVKMWTDIPTPSDTLNVIRTDNSLTIPSPWLGYTLGLCTNSGYGFNDYYLIDDPNAGVMFHKRNHLPNIMPFLIQNCTLSNSQYVIANDYSAGRSVDANRAAGDVVVESGVDYEIEYNGIVRLDRGFRVEKGARFSAFQRKF